MYRLELFPRAGSDTAGPIVINMKVFRFEDIRSLLETLEKRLPVGSVRKTEPMG